MLLPIIELACNQALEHDPAARAKVAALQGKIIGLEIKGLEIKNVNQKIAIMPQVFGIELAPFTDQTAVVTLAATPAALMKIARQGMDNAELEPGELEINGDPIVAQRFAGLASSLDIDWEGLLAEHIGELPAAFISRGLTTAQAIVKEGQDVVKSHVNKALIDDLEVVAQSSEVDTFLDGVDDLRAAVDRLEVRLKRVLET